MAGGDGLGRLGLGWLAGDESGHARLLALVIAVVVALVRSTRSQDRRPPGDGVSRDEAGRILAERFARGEIIEEQYTHQRELLRIR